LFLLHFDETPFLSFRIMLSMSNLSANQAENYYEKDDYYTQDLVEDDSQQQSQGKSQVQGATWYGKGATALGLVGVVEQPIFKKLLHGKTPQGGNLHAKRINPKNHRAATDYTFSAPKSVSIAALIQRDARVIQAHDQAVETALSVLEERYAQTRISTPQVRQHVTTGNVISAVFRHETSREQDPQLHSHCVVINATQLADGTWRSFSNEAIVAHQKLLGEIYQNELAYQLRQLGYEIEPRANGQFELKGYDPHLLNIFSTRTQQIQDYIEQWQQQLTADDRIPLDAHQKKQATLRTRRSKQTVPREILLEAWQQQIQAHSLQLPTLPTPTREANELSWFNHQAAIKAGIEHAAEREAVFRKSKIERFVLEHHLGQQSFRQLQQTIQAHPELVLVDPVQDKYTTQTAIWRELDTIRLMQQGRETVKAIATPEEVSQWMNPMTTLTNGQRGAIALAATTTDQIIAWQGVAGAGKTHSLWLYKELAESKGFRVKGFAPSAEAADGLARGAGIQSETIASLLYSQSTSNQPLLLGKEIWIVDEASLLSAKDAHALLQRADQEQARIVLVGDTRQLSAVEAGHLFKSLQAGGIAIARLDESLRQQTQELKTAVTLIAQDKVIEGIQALDQAGCIREIQDSEQQLQQLVDDYLKLSPQERSRTLLLAGTNQQRLELTQRIRERLQAEGTLGKDVLTLMGLRPRNLTTNQSCYASVYELGNILVPSQDYKRQGLVKAQQYTVLAQDRSTNQLTLETPMGQILTINPAQCRKTTVYEMQSIPIAVGDWLRWTKNDRNAGIRNGQTFTVDRIAPDGIAQITNSDGKTIEINLSGRQYLDYAWVSTIYSSQGKTADRVLALIDGITTNRESFYVTVSRAKHHLALYTSNKAALIEQAHRTKAKENVSDYIPLFQVVPNHAQTSQIPLQFVPASNDHRDLAKRIGERVRNRICQELTVDRPGTDCSASAREPTGTANSADAPNVATFASTLEQHVESLSEAIAGFLEERDLIECAGDLAQAITAVHCSLEYLEQSTENRANLAAAIDRLDAAVGTKTRQLQQFGQSCSEFIQQSSQSVPTTVNGIVTKQTVFQPSNRNTLNGDLPATVEKFLQPPVSASLLSNFFDEDKLDLRQRYQQMWHRYSQRIQANTPVRLDYLVGCEAFENGHNQKEIALMLTVGSPYVRQIHQGQGKDKARIYVSQTARAVCQKEQSRELTRNRQKDKQLEL
jgi:conjugative relaxase-like TrwC/TraI family protein